MRTFNETLDHRMFDFKSYYDEVAGMLPQGAVLAEVGVGAQGASACYLTEALLNQGKDFTFYWIDDFSYGTRYQMRDVLRTISMAGIGQWVQLIPQPSVEAACHFPDVSFDFVFIDASHKFEWTKADILLWYRKVKHGCWLAGHDYNGNEGLEVKLAVDEVIPKRRREIVETSKGYNVWRVQKFNGRPLC